ncbi:DUF2637 domain-containing protein [Kitasatospora sp. NPDC058170]|uniref:DUF2637 domain-containing protein n=1 Tax=Kitasatospora sp. NPDC058170 TaxID=3346364 RepID=UPI0036D993B3
MINRRPRVSPWDIAAIGVLGTFGFALSYDALQQMAQAIHVRGQLSYLFPVVVDGFIGYGVRALVILREAPWTARAYTWALFSSATGTSVWANAVHAIRLNQQAAVQADSLQLGDTAVGALSTIAPLALAGAVHLGIIVTRHGTTTPEPADQPTPSAAAGPTAGTGTNPAFAPTDHLDTSASTRPQAVTRTARAELESAPESTPAPRPAEDKLRAHRKGTRLRERIATRIRRRIDRGGSGVDGSASRSGGSGEGGPGSRSGGSGVDGPASRSGGSGVDGPGSRSGGSGVDGPGSRSGGSGVDGPGSRSGGSGVDGPGSRSGGSGVDGPGSRSGGSDSEEMLRIGREAAAKAGRITRAVVATAIRESGLPVSNQVAGELVQLLRSDNPPPPHR